MILKWFTKFQNLLHNLNNKGFDVQKIQTVVLIILTVLLLIYTSLCGFFGQCPLVPFAVTIVLFYYAMSFNIILQEDNE